jgi:hypothetical protein
VAGALGANLRLHNIDQNKLVILDALRQLLDFNGQYNYPPITVTRSL